MPGLRSGLVLASRYTLDRRLGGTGGAETWLAIDRMTRASVALKIAPEPDGGLLHREWQLSLKLVHSNIARVFEFHEGDTPFYSLQYIDGPDLSVLAGAPLADSLPAVASIADALRYAHTRDVVHCDLKASNILVDANGAPYLIDFGVAAVEGDAIGGGSLIASSPQRLAGNLPTPADDVFALGGLLYELLTGQPPYSAASIEDDIRGRVPDAPVAASGEAIPQTILTLLERMLAKDAGARPDAGEVVEVLRDAGFSRGTVPRAYRGARKPTTVQVATIAPQQHRRVTPASTQPSEGGTRNLLVGGAFVVLVILLAGVLFLLPSAVEEPTSEAPVAADSEAEVPTAADTTEADAGDDSTELPLRDQRVQDREATEEILGEFLANLETLEARAVERWGGLPYKRARAIYEAGDEAYLARDYATASDKYQEALDMIGPLLVEVDRVFDEAMQRGADAINAEKAAEAIDAYELAVAISPNSSAAARGLERAQNLDAVLDLLVQGARFEQNLELQAARRSFAQALDLDPQWQAAKQALARVDAAIEQSNFESRMSEGIAAMAEGDYLTARAAFTVASQMRPGAPEPADGLLQVDQALRLQSIVDLEQTAILQKQDEQWELAVETYEQLLELDSSLTFAQDGLRESSSMVSLFKTLDDYIAEPDALSSPATMQRATQTLIGITRMPEIGPRLSEQRDELSRLLKRASTPLEVQLVSDNLTAVSIYKVGRLGTFETRRLELRPGTYVAVGSRSGYRDVRLEFQVGPEIDMQPVVVRCEEPI